MNSFSLIIVNTLLRVVIKNVVMCSKHIMRSSIYPLVFLEVVRRLMAFWSACSLLLETKVFLFYYVNFFYLNMIFHCLFYFKQSLEEKSIQSISYRIVAYPTNQGFSGNKFE